MPAFRHGSPGEMPGRGEEDRRQLAMDLATTVAGLPEDLQDLCCGLMHRTVSAIARERAMPRSTLVHHVGRVRRRFEEAGLREYV